MRLSKQIIEKEWPLAKVQIVKISPGKDKRVTVRAKSDQGEFIFKIAARHKLEKVLKRDVAVLQFLENRGFRAAPKILKTRSCHLYQKIGGNLVYAMEHINGVVPKSSPKVWYKLGKVVASLHRIHPPAILKSAFTVVSQRTKMLALARKFKMERNYAETFRKLPNFINLPQAMVHTDVALNNAIQKPNGPLVLVDWDDAGKGPLVLDIGFVLTSFLTAKLKFERIKANAFFRGYSSIRKIQKYEKIYAVDAGLLFGLSYSIHDKRGIDHGYWRWTQYVARHRDMFEKVLGSLKR